MKVFTIALILLMVLAIGRAENPFWQYSQQLFNPFSWLRQGKNADSGKSTASLGTSLGTTLNYNPPTKTPMPLPLSYPLGSSVAVPASQLSSVPSSSVTPAVSLSTSRLTTHPKDDVKTTVVIPKKVTTKEVPFKDITSKEVPSKEVPSKVVSSKEVTSKVMPSKEVHTIHTKVVPSKEVHTKVVPLKEVPSKEALLKEVSSKEVPLKEVTQEVPLKELSNDEAIESKLGELDLGPVTVKVTPPPAPNHAKSPRTTLGTFGSSTTKRYKNKVTSSPFYSNSPYIGNSQGTRHQTYTSPVWTTVPITTHGTGTVPGHKDKFATDRNHYTQPQPQPQINVQATQGHLLPLAAAFSSSPSTFASSSSYPSSASHLASASISSSMSSSAGTTAALRATATVTEAATTLYFDTTTQEATGTTEEPRDNHRQHDFYLSKREKPQVKIAANISQNLLPLPAGASAALVKPTKYHYYPHNQHIYLLPECAIQQVCNAVYVRLNWTQPLCACPSRYRDPCSASLNSDDLHTTELQVDRSSKRALTLVKTCEPTSDMRICRAPRDWSLLALQNIRTGKSHYLVICRCPDTHILEGPMSHDQPTYASVPGIRVYGMMCVYPPQSMSKLSGNKRRGRPLRLVRSVDEDLPFPWEKALELAKTADWDD